MFFATPKKTLKPLQGAIPAGVLKITFDRHILSLSLEVGTVTHGYEIF